MQIIPYSFTYAADIAALLNNHLPFEPESAQSVEEAGGIRFLCVNDENEVIGYIAGYIIENFKSDFPYFNEELQSLAQIIARGSSMYSSHFVVHPNYRKMGIGTKLVSAYIEAAEKIAKTIVVVGWVQSDTNVWEAEPQFRKHGFSSFKYMPRYFEPFQVDCPSCNGLCYCDADIFIKKL